MTRINLVPPSELCRQHLVAEYRELPRVFALARPNVRLPDEYTMGPGHVKFFYDKLLFLTIRHRHLVLEMLARGYRPLHVDVMELLLSSHPSLRNNYQPTAAAVELSRQRILSRLPGLRR